MSSPALPSLAAADWLAAAPVRTIFSLLQQGGDEGRIIGGAVRNALFGLPITDIDFATTATPDRVTSRAEAAGIKVVPTGIDHGTLTLVHDGRAFEVTTLREDVETDGRRAVVRFGRDWQADAERRDFTINALSVDAQGVIHDPVGGYPDIVARRVRFIGEAERRIAEDRLRILRFFRFHAQYGAGEIDADGLVASIRAREGLRDLSAERIGQETRKLAAAAGVVETATIMQETGILGVVLGGVGYLGALGRLMAFEQAAGDPPAIALRLAALACRVEEDAERLAARLRLSNAERDRMSAGLVAGRRFAILPNPAAARRLLYGLGVEAYRDGVALAAAWGRGPPDDASALDLHGLAERWPPPRFPLGGRDLMSAGIPAGPAVGDALRKLEAWWIDQDFAPDELALRARLQQMVAAAQ